MTPKEYLEEIVLPTVADYERDTQSRRLAYVACIVTYHMADYLKKAGVESLHRDMAENCDAAWSVVGAVANGAKHKDNHRSRQPFKFVAGTDQYRPPAAIGLLECGWSELGDEEGSIVVPVGDDFLYADVLESLRTVILQYQMLYGRDYL